MRDKEFSGKHRENMLLYPASALPAERILLIGLGKEKGAGAERLRQALGTATSFLQDRGLSSFAVDLGSLAIRNLSQVALTQHVTEAVLLAGYRFLRYRTEKPDELPIALNRLVILVEKKNQIKVIKI